jgi:hypothetical protein
MKHNNTLYGLLFATLLSAPFSVAGFNGGNGDTVRIKVPPTRSAEVPLPNVQRTFAGDALLAPLVFEPATDPIDITYHPNPAVADDVKRAHDLFDLVMKENRLTDFLTEGTLQSLPMGIRKTIGGKEYVIVIDSMVLTPTAAYLVAYMSLPVPQSEQRLAFKGSNIRFTQSGGLTGNVRLTLLEDLSMPFSNHAKFNILGKNGETFIEWDCRGFKSLGLNAEVEFSRDYLVPDKDDGTVGEGRVTGNFKTVVNDWNDLLAEVTLSPFQVAKLEGFGFHVERAVFDFSDLNNASGMVFPEDYTSTAHQQGTPELWQGFYLKQLQIRLPKQFSSKNGGRKVIAGYDLLIDNLGFSGTLAAQKLLSLEEGTMSGWKFSLDSIGVQITTNEVKAAAFNGQVHVPVFKDGQLFSYAAVITADNQYLFKVSNDSTLQMNLFAAKAVIDKNSYLEINVVNGAFKPKAVLNGKLTISAGMSDKADGAKATLAGITFEALEISTVSPYIAVGAFSLGSEASTPKLANFPLSLENIDFRMRGKEIDLAFDIVLNLVGSKDGGFGAKGGLVLQNEVEYTDGFSFKFKGVELTELAVKIDGGAYKIEGNLKLFKDDDTYGSGIKGTVNASFQPGLNVQAMALFGNVNGDRYWFADALAKFEQGVVVFPGFAIYGFGGGVYYHMKQNGFAAEGDNIGSSLSGIVYTPDRETFLGLKATITLGTHPSQEAFNGDATFGISFNNSGGVNEISFLGNAYFAAPPLPRELANLKKKAELLAKATGQAPPFDDSKGSIYARLFMTFDVPNQTLHGNLTTYANVAGGVIKGAGDNGLCGEAVMHFASDEWYIHIGTPENRMALKLAGFFTLQGYMMVGTNIPAMPAPPAQVSEILSNIDQDRSADMGAYSKGDGFAFGASFGYNTGNLRFLVFYARFEAGAGFDMMLKNYSSDVRCEGASGPIGINGWYATGQAYGYFRGAIGVTVDLLFYSGDFEILSISAAVLLRAKLPNPVFLQGTVGGRFSILGGLVSGNCQFEMTIGEQCRMQSTSALEGQKIISAVTPATGEQNVNVFTAAQAVFSIPLDKEFEFTAMDQSRKSFRGKLALFKMYDGNTEVPCSLSWNDDKTVAALSPLDVLPSLKNIKVKVSLAFEEKVLGVWRPLNFNGKQATEDRELTFKTDMAPDYIPLSNVAYSYPMSGQYNFHPKETTKGYIKLIKGQPGLFTTAEWNQVGRFTTVAGQKLDFPIAYSSATAEVSFTLPPGLTTNTLYAFEIVNVPKAAQQAIDANIRETATLVASTGVEIRTRTAEGTLKVVKEKPVFSTHIHTSRFNRFTEKMNALTTGKGAYWPIYPDVHQLIASLEGPELFDRYELEDAVYNDKLVQLETDLNNPWYTQYIGPLLYDGYPHSGATIKHRAPQKLGIPPVRAVFPDQPNREQVLSLSEINHGVVSGTDTKGSIVHNMAFETSNDYYYLRQQAARLAQTNDDPWIQNLLQSHFPPLLPGVYKITFRYVLPGTKEITSETSKTITLN